MLYNPGFATVEYKLTPAVSLQLQQSKRTNLRRGTLHGISFRTFRSRVHNHLRHLIQVVPIRFITGGSGRNAPGGPSRSHTARLCRTIQPSRPESGDVARATQGKSPSDVWVPGADVKYSSAESMDQPPLCENHGQFPRWNRNGALTPRIETGDVSSFLLNVRLLAPTCLRAMTMAG